MTRDARTWRNVGMRVAALAGLVAISLVALAATDLTGFGSAAKVAATISWSAAKTLDRGAQTDIGTCTPTEALAFGTGANKSNQVWHDTRLLGAGLTDQLDLAGGLTNAFGGTVTFAKVHMIFIHNRSDETLTAAVHGVTHTANAAVIDCGPSAANGALILKAMGDILTLEAGDWTIIFSKAGKTITAGTGDLFDIVETATLPAAYEIIIFGEEST